jgi:hypothetical protein
VAVALLAAGCTQSSPQAASSADARVDSSSAGGPARITLSEQAARRIDIQSAVVEERALARTRKLIGDVVELPQDPPPISEQASTPRLLLDEQFAAATRDWPNDPTSTAWFARGTYVVHARHPGAFVAIDAPLEPVGDIELTARFRKTAGPGGGGYGLIVRGQSPGRLDGVRQQGQFLVFEVGDDGRFGAWQRFNDDWLDIQPWTASPAIRRGTAPNELQLTQRGDQFDFAINGTSVLQTSVVGAAASPAGVGIFVGGDLNEVAVERFTARSPADQTSASIAAIPQAGSASLAVRTSPLTSAELAQIDVAQPAMVTAQTDALVTASPVNATSTPGPLIYALEGTPPGLSVGQRVPIELVLVGNTGQRRVVPDSAVIYDRAGEPWVYVNPNPFVFVRHAVSIEPRPFGDVTSEPRRTVVLSRGPETGTPVVVVGAAQLYGIETLPPGK